MDPRNMNESDLRRMATRSPNPSERLRAQRELARRELGPEPKPPAAEEGERLELAAAAEVSGYHRDSLRRLCLQGRIESARQEIRDGRAVWTVLRSEAESLENPGVGRPASE